MRYQRHHQFRSVLLNSLIAEQMANNRNGGQAGDACQRFAVCLLNDSANQIDLTLLQTDVCRELVLADNRLRNTSQILILIDLRNVEIEVHGNFIVIHHKRRQVEVNAHIQKGKLRVNQRTHSPDCADTR